MKKAICILLALVVMSVGAMADTAPQISSALFTCAKQAVVYLASGEYERMVTILPFSDIAPGASEWQSFAGNYNDLTNVQSTYSVAWWAGSSWNLAVPIQEPSDGWVEALVLTSEDGTSFNGYRYATWSQVQSAYGSSDYVTWNQEYLDASPMVFGDW